MTTFGMVTTRASARYTPYALSTFFASDAFAAGDVFYLIDNDGAGGRELRQKYPQITVIEQPNPQGFATNMNFAMSCAQERKDTLVFLNNDLIFPPQWYHRVARGGDRALSSPFSNREVQYSLPGFEFQNPSTLDVYEKNPAGFLDVVAHHETRTSEALTRILLFPFFCIRVPYSVYTTLGPLDEAFGKGGGEDGDYCVRAALAGIPIVVAQRSLVLHFSGKSTWDGGESAEGCAERCKHFQEYFTKKWGAALTRLVIGYDQSVFNTEELRSYVAAGAFDKALKVLIASERNL
jgi:GT2 family glycosyltransferase